MNKLKTDLLTNDRSLNSCWVAPESRRTSPAKVGEFRSELVPSEHILASPRNFTGVSICSPASIYHAYVYVKIQKNISWGKRFEVARGYEEIVQDMTGFPKIGSCQTRSQIKVTEKYWNGGGPKPCLAHIMYIYNHHTIMCVYIIYTWTTPLKSMSDSDQEIFLNQDLRVVWLSVVECSAPLASNSDVQSR